MFLSCPIITSTIINAVWKMSLFNLYFTVPQAGLWIRIRMDPHSFSFLDPLSICRSGSRREKFKEKTEKMPGNLVEILISF